ncbi:MAG: hypothetical protein HZA08_02375 [Nitrospirae bacterium]|nr:hypothetical protein [Nitrospirota bacterium]
MDKDDLWVVEHFGELVTKYAGKYVAVVNETLVAVGDSRKEVEEKARAIAPDKMPSVMRIPREEDMACLLRTDVNHFATGAQDIRNMPPLLKERVGRRILC